MKKCGFSRIMGKGDENGYQGRRYARNEKGAPVQGKGFG